MTTPESRPDRTASEEEDRQAVLEVHGDYLRASSTLDSQLLALTWDPDPSNVHFALSGHTYQGLPNLAEIYDYLRPRYEIDVPYDAFDQDVEIAGDVAWVTSNRFGAIRWTGDPPAPLPDGPSLSRATEIMVRDADGWRLVHSHFSPISLAPRPGDI
jgi:ketosteroid isomerase-like protein